MFSKSLASVLVLAVASTAALTGCRTPTEKAESKAMSSIKDLRSELPAMNPQIDKVMNSLEQTLAGNNANPAASFKQFNSEFSKLQKHARTIGDESDKVSGNIDNYFKQYNREITAERDATQRANARDTEQTQRLNYNSFAETLKSGKMSYSQLVSNLNDIQGKLSGGINAQSIQSVNSMFSRATDNALSTKGAVNSITSALDKAIAAR